MLCPSCVPILKAAYLGMGWDVGTTGTNLGQLAICSWTFRQEEMCTLIFASVTYEMREEAELGRSWPQAAGTKNDQQVLDLFLPFVPKTPSSNLQLGLLEGP